MTTHPRSRIHYWKCDRPAAFHGTAERPRNSALMIAQLGEALHAAFPGKAVAVRPAPSQGNHLTFIASLDGVDHFARIEDGPEHDDYIEVESHLLGKVHSLGVPAPRVFAVDASRRNVPFAWQLMECISFPDLNQSCKQGALHLPGFAEKIGAAVARWQAISVDGFGPFDPAVLRNSAELRGFHRAYRDYFHLHLDRHLDFLVEHQFLDPRKSGEIRREIQLHQPLLDFAQACLVHKDLALWNILGSATEIAAFIDFDDAIAGDPMDDLSLLACFHDGEMLAGAIDGYQSVRPLPSEHRRRYWLHLLRNMIVKAVIRVGAGYFERNDGFFLIGAGSSGRDLRDFTRARIETALKGLRENCEVSAL